MKLVILVASLLATGVASAYTSSYHDYDAALRGITIDNACVTATNVKTINPVRHCAKLVPVTTGNGGEQGYQTDWVCQKWEVTNLSYPRAFEKAVCHEYRSDEQFVGCVRNGVEAAFLPDTIKVAYVTEQGERSNFPGVVKHHTFPSCN